MNHNVMMAKMAELDSLYRRDPAAARSVAMRLVARGLQAESGDAGMTVGGRPGARVYAPGDMLSQGPVRGIGGQSAVGLCYTRNFRQPCESFEDNCAMYNSFFESVSVDVGTVIDTDFDTVGSFDQLKWNLTYLQGTSSKDPAVVSGTPVAGALALPLPAGPTLGYVMKWSVAQQLSSPVIVTLFEVGTTNISGDVIERVNLQIELPPRVNGGWIYIPGAYRAATGMSTAQQQIQVAPPGATINVANSSDDIVWSVRKLSAFNTWTVDYLNLLAAKL